jgi:MFS family permease
VAKVEIVRAEQQVVLTRTVVLLGLVSFFADVSSEMLYPVTPVFLTAILGASMTQVGLIEGIAEAVASLLKTFSGLISDHSQSRKPWIISGYFFSAIAKPLVGLSGNWLQVLGARSFDRLGKGIRSSPRDALLAESVDVSQRGAAFGWHRAMDTLGAATGPLLTLFLLSVFALSLRSLFLWAVIPGLAAVAVLFLVPEKKALRPSSSGSLRSVFHGELPPLSRDFKMYLLAWGIFSVANSSDVFLLLRAKKSGVPLTEMILMYCFYNLIYALFSPGLGRLSDRLPRKWILQAGLGVFAAVYLGFAVLTRSWHFWILFGFYGLYMAATDGVGKALALDLIPTNLKATGVGLLGTVTGFATVAASLVAGELWDHVTGQAPFFYGTCGALVAALLLALLPSSRPAASPPAT